MNRRAGTDFPLSRRRLVGLAGAVASGTALGSGLTTADRTPKVTEDDGILEVRSGPMSVLIRRDPFGIAVDQAGERALTGLGLVNDERPAGSVRDADPRTVDGPVVDEAARARAAPAGRYGTFGFAMGASAQTNAPAISYGVPGDGSLRWFHATHVLERDGARFTLATEHPTRTAELSLSIPRPGLLTVDVSLSDETGVVKTGWSYSRADDERYLGFGERSDGVDQTGEVVENWAEEGPFSGGATRPVTDPTLGEDYQGPPPYGSGTNFPMPWFVSSRGYGFLLNSTYYNRFFVASDRDDAWHVETWEPRFSSTFVAGPTPSAVVERFTAHVGRQPDPVEWFFGPWYQPTGPSEFRRRLVERWREWDVPVSVAQTYTHYLPCGSHVGSRAGQRERTDHYHEHGYRITTYVNSFVCEGHPNGAYDEGDANGYFLETPGGQTYPVPYVAAFGPDEAYHGVVDFTDDEATEWWQGLIEAAIEDGYDGWMEDFGEYVPPNSVASDGRSGHELHNQYSVLYHRASHEFTSERVGEDFAQYVRAGYTGSAQYSRIVWGGDPSEDFSESDGLAAAVSQGLSMGLSGVAYWGTDIGGFHAVTKTDRTDPELLIRWLQYGAFNGVMRTQAEGYGRQQAETSERANVWHDAVRPIWRKFCKLRTQLFPYVWEHALRYQETGLPLIRHLSLAFPHDEQVYEEEAEYEFLFGDDLLVAPVVERGARERTLYLPEGRWVNFWDAASYDEDSGAFEPDGASPVYEGRQVITVDAPLDEIPLFVRAGTTLELLPSEVDTLTELGENVVNLSGVTGEQRELRFPE